MNIEVFFSASNFSDVNAAGKVIVVIDILRCTTTIVTALNNNAKFVIPASTIEKAMKFYKMPGEKVLMCGERRGKKIGNFDLGNSPLEFIESVVSDKVIVITTTNGTEAILKSQLANRIYMGSFLNFDAIVEKIKKESKVILLCSGKEGRFSLEDVVYAGRIINTLKKDIDIQLKGETSFVAEALGEKFQDIYEMLQLSDHGKYLESIGMEKDLEMCSKQSITKIVPEFKAGKIFISKD